MGTKTITQAGFLVTGAYLTCLGLYSVYMWSALADMRPNEFGDFLAGTIGPLALFWLVCGYLQQGLELRQNTEALKLQASELHNSTKALECQVEELRHSVEQQTLLAQHAQKQLALEIERNEQLVSRERAHNTPDLQIATFKKYSENAPAIGEITIKNVGPSVTILGISSNGVSDRLPSVAEFQTGDEFVVMPWRQGEERTAAVINIKFRTVSGFLGSYALTIARRNESEFEEPVLGLAAWANGAA